LAPISRISQIAPVGGIRSPQMRVERQIAAGRLALASFSLLAVWLDPTEPRRYDLDIYWLLSAYVVVSLVLAADTFRGEAPSPYRLLGYCVDLLTAFAAVFMSAGVDSPLFPLVAFVLFVGTRRWEGRVALWTTVGIVAAFVALGGITSLARDMVFELNDFIIRTIALALIAVFLIQIKAEEDRKRGEIERLAAPPDTAGQPLDQLLCRLLEWGAAVIGAPRMILAWEDSEKAWLHLVSWQSGECQHLQESPGTFTPMVAQRLIGAGFLCRHAGSSNGPVLHSSTTGLQRWRGAAVHPALRSRFSMDAVLSLAFEREHVKGRVFFLDKQALTADDLTLGEIVSCHIATRLNHFYLLRRLAEAAVLEERLRLARDLHDGAFHLLTGVALETGQLLRMPRHKLAGAQDRIRQIQDCLSDGQRTLRLLIDSLRMVEPDLPAGEVNLEARLKKLAERLERQWGVEVHWTAADCEDVPRAILDEVYLMIHEALVNTARHANATTASVSVTICGEQMRIVVADDGRGFDINGPYDHETLLAGQMGPWTLRERAASLGGTVAIESGPSLTVVEIRIPIKPARV
jgi:signal transduction histidine kinase